MNKIISRKIRLIEIILACIIFTLFFTISACKETAAEEGEWEEEEEEVAEEEEEGAEEKLPIVEETPEKIEWEGVVFSPIEGLRFDKGTFFAEADNPYGLKEGEKAGVFIKDAVEINGVMESSIGLVPKVIEVMQKEIMEKDKEFRYPLPFNLEEAKGIKIREVADTESDEWAKSEGYFWDNNTYLEISNVPIGTVIYSSVSTKENGYGIMVNYFGERSDYYIFDFEVVPSTLGESYFRNEKIDQGWLEISAIGIKLLPVGIENNITENEWGIYCFSTETKAGTPIANVITQEYLDDQYWGKKNIPSDPLNEPSISIKYNINQLKPKDKDGNYTGVTKFLNRGLESLLKLGEKNLLVFINPAE